MKVKKEALLEMENVPISLQRSVVRQWLGNGHTRAWLAVDRNELVALFQGSFFLGGERIVLRLLRSFPQGTGGGGGLLKLLLQAGQQSPSLHQFLGAQV